MTAPKILYGFFCEDVREEASGKISAIGLYGLTHQLRAIPDRIRALGFHVSISNPSAKPFRYKLTMVGPGLPSALDVQGQLMTDPKLTTNQLSWMIEGLVVEAPGTFVADLVIESEPPVTARFELEVNRPGG